MTGVAEEREKFIEEFTIALIAIGGREFADGSSVEEYAREVAPSYYEDKDYRDDGPEACAEADFDCWEPA